MNPVSLSNGKTECTRHSSSACNDSSVSIDTIISILKVLQFTCEQISDYNILAPGAVVAIAPHPSNIRSCIHKKLVATNERDVTQTRRKSDRLRGERLN